MSYRTNPQRHPLVSNAPFGVTCCAVMLMSFQFACQDKQEQKKTDEGEKKTAAVSRVSTVSTMTVDCDDSERFWNGPDKATVHVTLTSGGECPAELRFVNKKTMKETPAGLKAPAEKSTTGTVQVPDTEVLACACTGKGDSSCTCEITAVDPPLGPNVTLGTPTTVTPPDPVKNPATAPPIGTPVVLACGQQCPLWSGPASYVTVMFNGPQNTCQAKVIPKREGFATAGGEEITDHRKYSRTFGPVTSLTAECTGKGDLDCQFQVTEVITIP